MKTSERSNWRLKPRYPRLHLMRRRRQLDDFLIDDINPRHR